MPSKGEGSGREIFLIPQSRNPHRPLEGEKKKGVLRHMWCGRNTYGNWKYVRGGIAGGGVKMGLQDNALLRSWLSDKGMNTRSTHPSCAGSLASKTLAACMSLPVFLFATYPVCTTSVPGINPMVDRQNSTQGGKRVLSEPNLPQPIRGGMESADPGCSGRTTSPSGGPC